MEPWCYDWAYESEELLTFVDDPAPDTDYDFWHMPTKINSKQIDNEINFTYSG